MKKKLLAIATCLCMLTSLLPAVAMAAEYPDTVGHWAEESIARWSDAGVVQGSNGQFNPEGMMTRAEAAQVFTNLLKLTGKADLSAYTDVAADAWYADAFAACVAQGIMNGVAADQMDPTGTVTREMFFVMFARALSIQEESSLKGDFTDASEISSWAKGYVYALINNGYVKGTADGVISPELNINRASVMALLDQTIAYYVVEDGTVELKESGVVLVLADNVTITGDADATVVVAAEGAKVSMKGYTGDATVSVVADDVAITNAPAGTVITVADDAAGTTVNGEAVAAGEEIVIPEEQPAPGGGGSTGGGTEPGKPDVPSTERPNIVVGDNHYQWDEEEGEYFIGDGEEKEYVSIGDIMDAIEEAGEDMTITVDGKEYSYDHDLGEWFVHEDDEEEYVPTEDVEEALGGSNTMAPTL
ncbi:S-layer homology domain-containing protein [Intestinimonas butyriciproducens]|uniref:S-layer homology domain-containing protein n=1 Tax=Intestinimonas butyriciproducens TaxID=1297617 RepID=UPI001957F8EA|nr:S-layer homology domain-containing protein [Intestinimonas butyriciproducens]MBM6918756.1 S-layer homology domain-containing protein [Intestinimonas butyriciproducens]